MAVVDLNEQVKPITMGDVAETLPHALFCMLGMEDPNFCIQNDEQVTMRKDAKYHFIQAYASGYHGFVNIEAIHKVLDYAEQIYPTRDFVIPMWCPIHLIENRYMFLDDENWTLYVKDCGNEKGRLLI